MDIALNKVVSIFYIKIIYNIAINKDKNGIQCREIWRKESFL